MKPESLQALVFAIMAAGASLLTVFACAWLPHTWLTAVLAGLHIGLVWFFGRHAWILHKAQGGEMGR